jgi:hypothetical protein
VEPISNAQEVLIVLTAILRGEAEGAGVRERLRAAELLGKRLGLFDSVQDGGDAPVIIEGALP